MDWIVTIVVQLVIAVVVYLLITKKNSNSCTGSQLKAEKFGSKEFENLSQARLKSLNVPLTEIARPSQISEIIGQADGIKALRAALCGSNPQHVIIYGPPGIGKTCAARLVMNEAKANPESPFDKDSKFIEIDATCIRFDERSIADPLIGSVHDPIYQGAGQFGSMGVPQPKPGAVSKAHCGVLFLDEIGELHPSQMNKLLKVLEDRCVYFDSAYYSKENKNIPPYIHDIFENGMPADFRLIGATTRQPDEIPSALRSRCVEIYFRALSETELVVIARQAAAHISIDASESALRLCAEYAYSGRDVVNIMQLAGGIARIENRSQIQKKDVEWVASTCRYKGRPIQQIASDVKPGTVYGIGVSTTSSRGYIMEIECYVYPKRGTVQEVCTFGIVDEEQIENGPTRLVRRSTARASIENAIDAVSRRYNKDLSSYDIRFNIPGGMPVDGPSAGIAFALALYGAVFGVAPKHRIACTGEITCNGEIRSVGGVEIKTQAAINAGAEIVMVPSMGHRVEVSDKIRFVRDVDEAVNIMYLNSIDENECVCEHAGEYIVATEVYSSMTENP